MTAICTAQSFEKSYNANEKIKANLSGKIYTIEANGNRIGADIKKNEDAQRNIESIVKSYLLGKMPGEIPAVLKFSSGFASSAIKAIETDYKMGNVMEENRIDKQYVLKKVYKGPGDYIYYIDGDEESIKPLTILTRINDNYTFSTTDINAANASIKNAFINNLQDILETFRKSSDVAAPACELKDNNGTKTLELKNPAGTGSISLTNEQFNQLKGSESSKNGNVTVYALKSTTPLVENAQAATAVSKSESSIGKKDLIIGSQTYTYELLSKDGSYYAKLCGPTVDKGNDPAKPVEHVVTANSCKTGDSRISSMDELANFQQITDNLVVSMNTWVDIKNADYKKSIEVLHTYLKGEVAKAKEKEKKAEEAKTFLKNSHLQEVEDEKKTFTAVGVLRLPRDNEVKVSYTDEYGTVLRTEIVKIDSIDFTIEEGVFPARRLLVFTKQGIYTNQRTSIPVGKLNKGRSTDWLTNLSGDIGFVHAGEALIIEKDVTYIPDDVSNVVLTPESPSKVIHAASDLNSMVNFSIYSDLGGLLGRRANGLLITDVSGKFMTNTGNIFNVPIIPLQFVEANISLSKFDSKFKSIDSTNVKIGQNNAADTVDRMQLMQTAWLKGSLKLNLFSLKVNENQTLRVNLGARINIVNADSFFRKEREVYLFEYFTEYAYSINRVKNFGMDVALRLIRQRLADREPFANTGWEHVFNPNIAFFYYPFNNPASTIYLRFNYFANRNKESINFYQLQFGWKTGLNVSKK